MKIASAQSRPNGMAPRAVGVDKDWQASVRTFLRRHPNLWPVFSTLAFYISIHVASLLIGGRIRLSWVHLVDLGLQLVLAYLLFAVSKRVWAFLVVQGLLMVFLYGGHILKVWVLGGPITPDDLWSIEELVRFAFDVSPMSGALMLGSAAAIVAVALLDFRIRTKRALFGWVGVVALGMGAFAYPLKVLPSLDRYFGYSNWVRLFSVDVLYDPELGPVLEHHDRRHFAVGVV